MRPPRIAWIGDEVAVEDSARGDRLRVRLSVASFQGFAAAAHVQQRETVGHLQLVEPLVAEVVVVGEDVHCDVPAALLRRNKLRPYGLEGWPLCHLHLPEPARLGA